MNVFDRSLACALVVLASALPATAAGQHTFEKVECAEIESVSTTAHTAIINGQTFRVRGAPRHGTGNYKATTTKGLFGGYNTHIDEKTVRGTPYWKQLAGALRACGHDEAAEKLRLWRKAHREVVVGWATLYGIPWALVMQKKATEHRAAFERAFTTVMTAEDSPDEG